MEKTRRWTSTGASVEKDKEMVDLLQNGTDDPVRKDIEKDKVPSSPQTLLANLMSCRSLCPMVESWGRKLLSSLEKDQVNDLKLDIDKFLGLDA